LNKLEGHYLSGFGEGADDPHTPIELLADAVEAARSELDCNPATLDRFERVSSLIEGFESPYGMELLATVHWVAEKQAAQKLEQTIRAVHGWSERKKMFTPYQITAEWTQLSRLGWFS
jgi:hypothetical protein